MAGELKIFGGRAHPALVPEICEYLEPPGAGKVSRFNFPDGETFCQIEEDVRGRTSSSSSRPARRSTRT